MERVWENSSGLRSHWEARAADNNLGPFDAHFRGLKYFAENKIKVFWIIFDNLHNVAKCATCQSNIGISNVFSILSYLGFFTLKPILILWTIHFFWMTLFSFYKSFPFDLFSFWVLLPYLKNSLTRQSYISQVL